MTVSTHKRHAATTSAATATISVADGDDSTNGQFTEGNFVSIISHDGTKRIYVLCDGSESGASATGTVLVAGADTGASTLSAGTAALGTCVAFNNNLNTHTQALVLNELKAAITHSNGHDTKITAGADVSGDGSKSIIFTQATSGEKGNTSILSTLDSDIVTVTNFTGGHAEGDKKDKHTILNGGNISSAKGNSKSLLDIVKGRKVAGSQVIASTGSAHHPGIEAATGASSNIFAYNPSSPQYTRSITDTGFVIKQGVVNKIAGTALNPILIGSRKESLATGSVHVPNGIHKYKRLGAWSSYVLDAFGTKAAGVLLQNEDGSDLTAKSDLSTRGASISLAVDHAAFGHVSSARATGASELVFLIDFVDRTTSGGNFQDYSAITG